MAFHEIDSVIDINSGHRVIIYFIEGRPKQNAAKLSKTLEAVLRTLEKKNDDVLIVKVVRDSEQFLNFEQLYKPEIKGQVTLFVVNNEGIPIVCQHIYEAKNIPTVIWSICNFCDLNPIPTIDLDVISESKISSDFTDDLNSKIKMESSPLIRSETVSQTELPNDENNTCTDPNSSALESIQKNENLSVDSEPLSTQLQIRLPDGSRDKKQFDKDAMLNEVWVFISTQYKLKDFDLKTYDHKNFSELEYENTLKDLGLYPNGVVIVVPKLGVSINNHGWIGSMLRFGLYQLASKTTNTFMYIQGFLAMIWNRLFFSNTRPTGDINRRRVQNQPTQNSNSGQSRSQRSRSSTTSFGNIHTLRRNDDSDDENNRYNGNSTQQK